MEVLVWAVVVLVIFGVLVWRGELLLRKYLKAYEVDDNEREVALLERRTAAELANRIIDETAALKRAELALKTAKAKMDASLIEATRKEREAVERSVIEANRKARIAMAEEFARDDHNRQAEENPVALYDQYMQTIMRTGVSQYHKFDAFMVALRTK